MEVYLLSQGMAPADIDDVPVSHRADLYRLIQEGVIGWNAQAYQSQLIFGMLWDFHQSIIQAFGGKGNLRKKQPKFEEVFPVHGDALEWVQKQRRGPTEAEAAKNLQGAFTSLLGAAESAKPRTPYIEVESCQ